MLMVKLEVLMLSPATGDVPKSPLIDERLMVEPVIVPVDCVTLPEPLAVRFTTVEAPPKLPPIAIPALPAVVVRLIVLAPEAVTGPSTVNVDAELIVTVPVVAEMVPVLVVPNILSVKFLAPSVIV